GREQRRAVRLRALVGERPAPQQARRRAVEVQLDRRTAFARREQEAAAPPAQRIGARFVDKLDAVGAVDDRLQVALGAGHTPGEARDVTEVVLDAVEQPGPGASRQAGDAAVVAEPELEAGAGAVRDAEAVAEPLDAPVAGLDLRAQAAVVESHQ